MIAAGIGLRPGTSADEIAALVARAASEAGCAVEVLAVPFFRANEAGVVTVAARLGLALHIIGPEALQAAQPDCPTRSARAQAETGFASVAEGCALAACAPAGRLALTRIASANATCALATGARIP